MLSVPVRREVAATLRLAAPLVGAQLAQMSMSFVDVVMVGRLGTSALAAAVLGSTAFFTLSLICVGVILAVNPTVAQAVGAGDDDLAARATRQGLWLSVILGVPLFVALGWSEEGLLALGQDPDTAALAAAYLRAIRWGIVPNLMFSAFRGFYEGTGRARPVLLATIVGVAVNVVANNALMYGKWGLPALGLEGTGWSSALVFTAMAASLAIGIRVSPALRRFGVLTGLRSPDPVMLGTLVKLGAPIGVTFGLEAGLFSAATLLVGWLGETPLAAHQIALNAASFTFMVPLGIGMAATVRVGQLAGAGNDAGARRAGFVAIALGGAFMACAATFLWLRPDWVVFLYAGAAPEAELAALATALLGIAAVFQLVDGIQATAAGALRGLKDTTVPAIIGAVAYWGVGLGVGAGLAFGLDWGARGLWWGLTAGLAAAAVLLVGRFQRLVR
ncbi:MATE family efflux transporter [Rubricoccus marinus]|uniref:Multidrug-efflux transporter n=1 Tax=Rubricoccus marinus TaxID=716817 RepID=A0A259U095_9BACT|nr:MATE family efflux transporter [Rubricoccus marinus]OZC03244.1 hypothetical protein BSZ36_09810 [Rubricoccus marinus]